MKPEEYKIGTNIIYRYGPCARIGSLYEGEILEYSDTEKYIHLKSKNESSHWYDIRDINIVDIVKKSKSDNSEYIVDPINKFLSKKKQCEEEMQKLTKNNDIISETLTSKAPFISGFTEVPLFLKTEDVDDPKMTEEDWNAMANQLYSNKNTYECYPKNYSETDCRYFLEIYNNTDWKLCLRNNLSVPKFDLSGELHPYTLGEGKIDKPEMISMYTFVNLKRIVDGLNLVAKPNENLNSYPEMSVETFPYQQTTTDYFEKYKKENKD